jgi:hypothetical protein
MRILCVMHNMSEIIHETQIGNTDKKKLAFEEKLQEIDAKYLKWFSSRVNAFSDGPDKLSNYYRYFYNSEGEIQLYLKEGLPLEIGKDCRNAFKAVFYN